MKLLSTIGTPNQELLYVERPTVKALLFDEEGKVLIINEGLLPGGGVESNEDDLTALKREILEEVGMTISGVEEIGAVVQYRSYLQKKYIINGYKANFESILKQPSPQDSGESHFKWAWYKIEDAIHLVHASISKLENSRAFADDAYQGKLYNLKTTAILLESVARDL